MQKVFERIWGFLLWDLENEGWPQKGKRDLKSRSNKNYNFVCLDNLSEWMFKIDKSLRKVLFLFSYSIWDISSRYLPLSPLFISFQSIQLALQTLPPSFWIIFNDFFKMFRQMGGIEKKT